VDVILEALSQGMKWPELAGEHVPSSIDEGKNVKSYNSSPPENFNRVILN
jgi:hypothetical protein